MRNDLTLYERHAGEWWDAEGPFARSLHVVNRALLPVIAARVRPGDRVLDLACGGGLLAEPLAKAGARVLGIDRSRASLATARNHGAGIAGLNYLPADIRRLPLADGCADLVVCADILEHLAEWREVLAECARVLRPGGRLFVATINRSWFARLAAVTLGEGLGFIPKGTHDSLMFIRPAELYAAAIDLRLADDGVFGVSPLWRRTVATWRLHLAVGGPPRVLYGAWFVAGSPANPVRLPRTDATCLLIAAEVATGIVIDPVNGARIPGDTLAPLEFADLATAEAYALRLRAAHPDRECVIRALDGRVLRVFR